MRSLSTTLISRSTDTSQCAKRARPPRPSISFTTASAPASTAAPATSISPGPMFGLSLAHSGRPAARAASTAVAPRLVAPRRRSARAGA